MSHTINLPIYWEFEVVTLGVAPRVWRRLLIAEDQTFAMLHLALSKIGAVSWAERGVFWETPFVSPAIAGTWGEAFYPDQDPDLGAGFRTRDCPSTMETKLAAFFGQPGHTRCILTQSQRYHWHLEITLRNRVTNRERFQARLAGGDGVFPRRAAMADWALEKLRETDVVSGDSDSSDSADPARVTQALLEEVQALGPLSRAAGPGGIEAPVPELPRLPRFLVFTFSGDEGELIEHHSAALRDFSPAALQAFRTPGTPVRLSYAEVVDLEQRLETAMGRAASRGGTLQALGALLARVRDRIHGVRCITPSQLIPVPLDSAERNRLLSLPDLSPELAARLHIRSERPGRPVYFFTLKELQAIADLAAARGSGDWDGRTAWDKLDARLFELASGYDDGRDDS